MDRKLEDGELTGCIILGLIVAGLLVYAMIQSITGGL